MRARGANVSKAPLSRTMAPRTLGIVLVATADRVVDVDDDGIALLLDVLDAHPEGATKRRAEDAAAAIRAARASSGSVTLNAAAKRAVADASETLRRLVEDLMLLREAIVDELGESGGSRESDAEL